MKIDYHVHTEFSNDSDYPMEKVVQDAIAMGLDEICFTDHVDYEAKSDWEDPDNLIYQNNVAVSSHLIPITNVKYLNYYQTIQNLKKLYGNQISLKLGLEFGMQAHTIERFENLFKQYPFDFIILSIHEIENKELWNQNFQHNKTQQEYNEQYYESLLYLVQNYHHYSVLGHMDIIRRYDPLGNYPFKNLKAIITEILKNVIADNKGIEINTSSYRYGIDDLTPSRDILKLYKELGGRILTIGSDSHKKEHLGAFIDKTKDELKSLGFKEFCTFDQMKPIFHNL